MRADAVRVAAESDEHWSLDVLLAGLDDHDAEVRREAAHGLGELRDPRALEPLIQALADPDVAPSAAWALGELRDPFAGPALAELLDDPDVELQGAAARALGAVGDASSVPLLQELVADPATDPWVCSVAQESLGELDQGPVDARPPRLIVWALGVALVVAGLAAAALWGVLGLLPFAVGLVLLLVYQFAQLRRARRQGWVWYGGGSGIG